MRTASLLVAATLSTTSRAFFTQPTIIRATSILLRRDMSTPSSYFAVHVSIVCKPGTSSAFKHASLLNARESSKEPGILRFDVLQDTSEPDKFTLVEVYKEGEDAPKAHKETEHYKIWRDTVADMMAVPREAQKFNTIFPALEPGWGYPSGEDLE
ncbi:hypothetical protein TrLO_g10265 [Triparma laevis f. longispina]|uniref:ABM domain-containing protein n=1 Tax=Triparma laevis f. longispina TaxID=1714387 RepID=A0A9W7FPL3_9STRA|nr:hypothetical protein TrLO_g10265 [Triparma laevis f. longispina]